MNYKDKKINLLLNSFIKIDSIEESKSFIRDLMTESEITELSNRLYAAILLSDGITYKKIEKETSLSSRTIARISYWLKNGNLGYQSIINKIHPPHIIG